MKEKCKFSKFDIVWVSLIFMFNLDKQMEEKIQTKRNWVTFNYVTFLKRRFFFRQLSDQWQNS